MLESLKEVLAEKLDIDATGVTEATSFTGDLGIDSLDLFDLVMVLEDKYGVEIPSEDLENIATVGDMINYLKNKGAQE